VAGRWPKVAVALCQNYTIPDHQAHPLQGDMLVGRLRLFATT
jgi:hypothetical protein